MQNGFDIMTKRADALQNLVNAMLEYVDANGITEPTDIVIEYHPALRNQGLSGVKCMTEKPKHEPAKHPITHGHTPHCTTCGATAELQDNKYWHCPNTACSNNCHINGIDDIHFTI